MASAGAADGRSRIRSGLIFGGAAVIAAAALAPAWGAEAFPPPRPKPSNAALTALVESSLSAPVGASLGPPGSRDAGDVLTDAPEPEATAAPPSGADTGTRQSPGPRPKPQGGRVAFLSADEFATAKRALDAAFAENFGQAHTLVGELADPTVKTIVDWLRLRSSPAGFEAIVAFLDRHPDWPEPDALRARAENILYRDSPGPDATVQYFRRYGPVTGIGMVALASAYLDVGDKANATRWFERAWREERLSESLERVVRERCGCVTGALDRERLDRMAYARHRAETLRAGQRLGGAYLKLAEAHIASDRNLKAAETNFRAVPESHRDDVALMLSRATWLRRHDRDGEARAIMLAAPGDAATVLDAEAWWTERRLIARRALGEDGAARDAYRIASAHALESGNSYADAEFLSGWIALRYLSEPSAALRHFDNLRRAVDMPISIARAEYWLARANEALGREETAREHMAAAARHGITFYGQLARNAAMGGASMLDLPTLSEAQWRAGAAIMDSPLMRAAQLLAAAGHRQTAARFLRHLSYTAGEPGALQRVAHLANLFAMPQVGVRAGKVAVAAGAPLHDVAYPTADFPLLSPPSPVELPLLLALTRQESEFAWQASSSAGARGLMQVMPATGKMLARRAGVGYSTARLGSDPAYNANLGSLYLAGLIEDFGGSYVLAVAAYNAGPGRVREWIDRFGDPRDAGIDVVDWIETIPFNETRNYVQRVLENLQVYRARLAGGSVPLKLAHDLARGRDGDHTTIALD